MNLVEFIQAVEKAGIKEGYENYFRGHADRHFELYPSIYRHGLIASEHLIFKEAIARTPYEFEHHRSTFEKLVKMQHYGIPTRLLDITSNPLVALFFACVDHPEADGEVIFFQVPIDYIKYYDSDAVSAISNISRQRPNFTCDFKEKNIKQFNRQHHMGYLHHSIKEEKSYYQKIIDPGDMQQVFVVKAKLDNARIIKQQGFFMIFGIEGDKSQPANIPDQWILNRNRQEIKLVIPKEDKKAICDQLKVNGYDRSTLFPEIEYQGRHLFELYRTDGKSC